MKPTNKPTHKQATLVPLWKKEAARVQQLEAQLERQQAEARKAKAQADANPHQQQTPSQNTTVIVKNDGCLGGAAKGCGVGCLLIVIAIVLLAMIGRIASS